MKQPNEMQKILKSILGKKFRPTATSFFTSDDFICFTFRTGKFRMIKLNESEFQKLKERKFLGTFGWTI